MKKIGVNKRNPNPPWPNEQAVVAVPNGSSAGAVGMKGQNIYSMSENENINGPMMQNGRASNNENRGDERVFNGANYQIMGEMTPPTDRIMPGRMRNGMFPMQQQEVMQNGIMQGRGCMENTYITGYLCSQTGKYVRIEFLFGEQTHVEKTGVLREVGRNFIVLQEMGTENMVACSLDKIKFINIYNINRADM